jgi:transcriptional regulator with XRE-family HTH domain
MRPAHSKSTHAAAKNFIFTLRRNRGYPQKHLARLIGCSIDTVSAYERGTKVPSLARALLLEIVLGARLPEMYLERYRALERLAIRRATALSPRVGEELRGRVLRKD